MNVLIAMTGPPGTGSGMVAEAVLAELVRRGHQALLFYPGGAAEAEAAPPGHRVWRFPLERDGVRLAAFPKMILDPHPADEGESITYAELSAAQLELFLAAGARALAAAAAELDADLVECHHLWSMPLLARAIGLPYVAVPHHSDQMALDYDERFADPARRGAAGAALILPISRFVRDEVLALYPVDPQRVVVQPPGYDEEVFRPHGVGHREALAAAGLDLDPELPLVTFSGKVSDTKGVDVLLQANHRLQRERPAALVVAGTGELAEAFPAALRDSFELTNVAFPGHLDQKVLAGLHENAVASVVPSRQEGFGLAGLEAMACGAPLVASEVGGLPEYAVGRLVPPEDPDALAAALVEVLELAPDEAEALRRQCLQVADGYSWRRVVDRRLELYERALAEPVGAAR